MKINVVSDIHLETGYQELPGGEVLVLAGDIGEARDTHRDHHQTRLVDRKIGTSRWFDFFNHECAKYEKVFYVMGNHEHYGSRIDKTPELLNAVLPKNVKLLNNDFEEYSGVLFLGGTLWTDCNNNDPITLWHLKQSMSDYRYIKIVHEDKHFYSKLYPEYTVRMHKKTLDYFCNILKMKENMPTVIITHHAPTSMSLDENYKNDFHMNGGFVSNLSNFILDHEQIKYWIHGHVHNKKDYMVGNTRVVCNPRGYVGYDSEYTNFDANFTIEINP